MAVDTYDPVLGLILQGTGNNNNSWGTTLNNSMIKMAARGIAGMAIHTVTGGTLDLSAAASNPPNSVSQVIDHIQYFNGALTSNQTVILPALPKTWLFINLTSGAFQILVKTPGQSTPTQVPQSTYKWLWCEGSIIVRVDINQVGEIVHNGMNGIPVGQLLCNGASVLRADYPDLFGRIGGFWGAVDGTHFTVPDFMTSNRFLRAAGGSLAAGTVQNSANLSHVHQILLSNSTTGSAGSAGYNLNHQHTMTTGNSNQDLNHAHGYTTPSSGVNSSTGGGGFSLYGAGAPPVGSGTGTSFAAGYNLNAHAHTGTTDANQGGVDHLHALNLNFNSQGGSADAGEARPNNTAVYIGIRI